MDINGGKFQPAIFDDTGPGQSDPDVAEIVWG